MALTEINTQGIKNLTIKREDLEADIIDQTKLADNAVAHEHIADGAVIAAKIPADAIDGSKIADDAVGAEHIETLDSDVFLIDNASVVVGAGSDGIYYSDGTNVVIRTALANNFEVQSNQASGANHTIAKFKANNAVELYYNNAKRFETSNTGSIISGQCVATSFHGDGSALTGIDAGATGGGTNKIFWENGTTIDTDYTVGTSFGAACNAMSAGPITINTGKTVTVDAGDTWTIV